MSLHIDITEVYYFIFVPIFKTVFVFYNIYWFMSLHEWVYIHTARMQSFSAYRQPSLFNCFLKGGKHNSRSLRYTLISLTASVNFSVSSWTAKARRTGLDLSNKPVYEINSFGGCISSVNQFTVLSKQIGEIRLLIDARDVSATGCDHIRRFLYRCPCYPILQLDHVQL